MFLLDTHTLIWFLDNDLRLPTNAKKQIESSESVFVSMASIWEIAIKINIGKLILKQEFQKLGRPQTFKTQTLNLPLNNEFTSITFYKLPITNSSR